jgi:hypothetical protein
MMFIDVIKGQVSLLARAPKKPSRAIAKLAQRLPGAECFKIDALIAFRDYLMERKVLDQHFDSVRAFLGEHEAEFAELLARPVWLEWLRPHPHGLLCVPLDESDVVNFIQHDPNRNFLCAFFFLWVDEHTDNIELSVFLEDDTGNFYSLKEDGTVRAED